MHVITDHRPGPPAKNALVRSRGLLRPAVPGHAHASSCRRAAGEASLARSPHALLYRELLLEQPKTDTDESIRERTYQSISLKRKVEGAVTVDGAVPLSPSLPPASASCASRRANKQERVRTGCCIASPIATFRDAEIRLLGVHKAPSASSR